MTNDTAWPDAASTVKYSVQLGTWINWSRGRVMGATLTMNRVDGNLLIAFTAVFVGIVTERIWRIACVIFYRCYSSSEPRDALYHQQQAILRNSTSPVSAVWTLSQLIWTWHNVATRCLLRILPTVLTALLCLCIFTVAGGFSSSISSGITNEVLLNGTNCGVVSLASTDPSASLVINPYFSQLVHSAASYAQQCYSSSAPGTFDCSHFVKDHLPSTINNQADCPFSNKSICRSQTSNLRLDTGYLSLNEDLGTNSPPSENILFRAILHCAPLKTQGYSEPVTGRLDNFTNYYYGRHTSGVNYTHTVESLESQYNRQAENIFRGGGSSFILFGKGNTVYHHEDYMEEGSFSAIPDLFDPDGDTIIVFLTGNGIEFRAKTFDPWYRATLSGSRVFSQDTDGPSQLYRPEEAASPMGCLRQHQFCNPSSNTCGPLASYADAQLEAAPLFGMTAAEWENVTIPRDTLGSRFQWLMRLMTSTEAAVQTTISTLGPDALTSLKYINRGTMGPISDTQWQLDVEYWWSTYLAGLQAGVVDTARGPIDPKLSAYKLQPFNSHMQDMCNNQKIRSNDYISFSLFGLYFTFITGGLIIVTSYILEPVFTCLYDRRKYREYTYLEWYTSETLQLQRMAFEGMNSGTWSGYTDTIPRTKQGEILGSLVSSAGSAGSGDQEAELASLDDLLDDTDTQTCRDSDQR